MCELNRKLCLKNLREGLRPAASPAPAIAATALPRLLAFNPNSARCDPGES